MTFYNLGHVVGSQGLKGDKGDRGEKGDKGDKGDRGRDAPLTDTVLSSDTAHATSGKAVYDYVTGIIGDINEYITR